MSPNSPGLLLLVRESVEIDHAPTIDQENSQPDRHLTDSLASIFHPVCLGPLAHAMWYLVRNSKRVPHNFVPPCV